MLPTFCKSQTVGTIFHTPEAYEGYTLLSPLNDTNTFLINNCGQVINTWASNYTPGNETFLAQDGTLWRAGQTDNMAISSGGAGGIIEQFDWDGNLLWQYELSDNLNRMHHDFTLLPNGNILVITWEVKTQAEAVQAGRDPSNINLGELWTDKILEIQPVGTSGSSVVWEWDFWDHLIQDFEISADNYGVVADSPRRIDINLGNGAPDWLHCNAIDYHPALDQIVISSRAMDEIYIIDHSTTTAEAATSIGGDYGHGGDFLYRWGNPLNYQQGSSGDQQLFHQHDIHWIQDTLSDGDKLMVFNNDYNDGSNTYSTVNLICPDTNAVGDYFVNLSNKFGPDLVNWTYALPDSLASNVLSGAQRLPNGNTAVCSGRKGTLVEINPAKEQVWAYVLPISNAGITTQGDTDQPMFLFNVKKYAAEYPGLDGKDLTPGAKIELNPIDNCSLYAKLNKTEINDVSVYPNPSSGLVNIYSDSKVDLVKVYSMQGQLLIESTNPSEVLDLSHLEPNLYLLQLSISGSIFAQRIVIQ